MLNEQQMDPPRRGTHCLALDRAQIEELGRQFRDALSHPDLKTLLVIATTDADTRNWFRKQQLGFQGQPPGEAIAPALDSVYLGDVYTLGFAADPETFVIDLDLTIGEDVDDDD